jgi:hypothetical protein
MGECFTVTHDGLTPGIYVSAAGGDKPYVTVGANYERRGGSDDHPGHLYRVPNKVQLDGFYPPTLDNGRLMAANVTRGGGRYYLRSVVPSGEGVLVFIDTAYEGPCVQGGQWTIEDSHFVQVIAFGNEGHKPYTAKSHEPFAESTEEMDTETCYNVGLLLLKPGARLKITFNAPGAVRAELTFDGTAPSFRITEKKVDPDYTYEPPDRDLERKMRSDIHDLMFDDYDL